jgi:serine/threonine protein kinase
MKPNPEPISNISVGSAIGNYRIVRLLGSGGMGSVYEARHRSLDKRVAIKVVRTSYDSPSTLAERFLREGRAGARVRHPNVIDVIDVGTHGDAAYLVLEYLEGENLNTYLEREGALPVAAIADIMIPVVSALAAVHDVGIVHRDVKPENIFLTRNKAGGLEPKVLDFGISKWQDEQVRLTGENTILGTPLYMSPEQAENSPEVDLRSDIYSLGLIMYECAAGEHPCEARSLMQLLDELRSNLPVRPLTRLRSEVPAAFSNLVAKAIHKDPARRFQSAAELGQALLPFASARLRLAHEAEFRERLLREASTQADALPKIVERTRRQRWFRRRSTLAATVLCLTPLSALLGWAVLHGRFVRPNLETSTSATTMEPAPAGPPSRAAELPRGNTEPEVARLSPDAADASVAHLQPSAAGLVEGDQHSSSSKHATADSRAPAHLAKHLKSRAVEDTVLHEIPIPAKAGESRPAEREPLTPAPNEDDLFGTRK